MGTEITLDISNISLTYSKNYIGINHGSLFQEKDRKPYKSEQINYDFFSKNSQDPAEMEMSFVRPLKDIIPRLELLGFSLKGAEEAYNEVKSDYIEQCFDDYDSYKKYEPANFEEFLKFVTSYNLKDLDNTFISGSDENRLRVRGRFYELDIVNHLPSLLTLDAYSEASYFGGLINIIHPYFVLRILAENPENLNEDVIWQYGPLVEAGWASHSEFKSGVTRSETFLIATEGTSDTQILNHAFKIIYPDIFDFFKFIDAEASHPFTGASNLVNFAQGLINIDIQNKIIFLFDNDAEGYFSYMKLSKLALPINLDALILPDIDEFNKFSTLGPEGVGVSNINGRAAAIECYLDLNYKQNNSPRVTWTNYKDKIERYHGSLDNKEFYTKKFLLAKSDTLLSGSYNIEKIRKILNVIILKCQNIASRMKNDVSI